MKRSLMVKAAAGVSVAICAVALGSVPASAYGQNSVFGTAGTVVSLAVHGESVNVSFVEGGVLFPYGFGTICNGSATARGTRISGAAWSKTWGYFSGCIPTSWASTTSVGLAFKSGTTIKLEVRHDGSINAGKPQVGIWA